MINSFYIYRITQVLVSKANYEFNLQTLRNSVHSSVKLYGNTDLPQSFTKYITEKIQRLIHISDESKSTLPILWKAIFHSLLIIQIFFGKNPFKKESIINVNIHRSIIFIFEPQ